MNIIHLIKKHLLTYHKKTHKEIALNHPDME